MRWLWPMTPSRRWRRPLSQERLDRALGFPDWSVACRAAFECGGAGDASTAVRVRRIAVRPHLGILPAEPISFTSRSTPLVMRRVGQHSFGAHLDEEAFPKACERLGTGTEFHRMAALCNVGGCLTRFIIFGMPLPRGRKGG